MVRGCKGVCELKYGAIHSSGSSKLLQLGWKICNTCCVVLQYEGKFCPCCSMRLSSRSNKRTRLELAGDVLVEL